MKHEKKSSIEVSEMRAYTIDDVEIEDCPFCNHNYLTIHSDKITYYVFCRQCGAKGPFSNCIHGAIDLWNYPSLKKHGVDNG